MTKDRLQEMRKLMEEGEHQNGCENTTKEKPTPLVTFFEHARNIKLEIEDLKGKVSDLKFHLRDNQQWKDMQTRKELERKIEEEKLIIGTLAKTIRINLKSMKDTSCGVKGATVIQRIKDVQLNAILNELNEVLRDYLNCLVQHRERSVKILKDMMEVKGDNIADVESLLEEGKIAIFTNNLLIGDMEEKYKLREAEEIHKEIIKMEYSIVEIKNLFNELSLIIDIQGEKVNEVENLVEKNLTKVESGKEKLTSANKKKGKLRYKKIMIMLICGGIILVVLFLLTAL